MKVKLARTAGFCMGVRRAVELVLEEGNRGQGPIVTFGPLIHNAQVLDLLAEKGILVADNLEGVSPDQTAVIRAHGIPPQVKAQLKDRARRMIDATCPRVVKVQMIIRRHTGQGTQAIILGDKDHAEVQGLLGYADGQGVVVGGVEDVADMPDYDRVLLVAQTTQSEALFNRVAKAVRARWPEAEIHNTICHATHERQAEVVSLAGSQEGVVVVGGSFSANTQRLAQIAREAGAEVMAVETEADLDRQTLERWRTVGVTAGASTPTWMIRKVVEELRSIRGRGESRLKTTGFRVYRFLLKSSTLVALGGAGLAAAVGLNLSSPVDWRLAAVPFFYLYAMHVLNHFVDRRAAIYNDPDRAKFFIKHRFYLIATASLSAILGLAAAAGLGPKAVISLTVLLILGLGYSIRLVPARWEQAVPYVKLKDFPGSKPMSIGLAWGAVCGLWPVIAFGGAWHEALIAALAVAALAFTRSAFFDIMDIQGDLVVGKETLAIVLGEKRTMGLLRVLSTAVAVVELVLALTGLLSPAGYIFAVAAAAIGLLLAAYSRQWIMPGAVLEGLVDTGFLAAGVLAGLVWLIG